MIQCVRCWRSGNIRGSDPNRVFCRQRVAIASAISAGAQILLFDEPTSGLDYAHMEKVGILLRRLAATGKTVLVSTHDPELIEQCCDYELYIRKGRVISLEKRS